MFYVNIYQTVDDVCCFNLFIVQPFIISGRSAREETIAYVGALGEGDWRKDSGVGGILASDWLNSRSLTKRALRGLALGPTLPYFFRAMNARRGNAKHYKLPPQLKKPT